jgi:hypothetical protein
MNKIISIYYLIKQNIAERFFVTFNSLAARIYVSILLVLNIVIWIAAKYIAVVVGADQIALHYSVGFGIDYYGDTNQVYVIPFLGLVVILLNFILFSLVSNYKDKNFIAHVLFAGALVVNIILLIAVYSVYIINF